MFGFIENPQEQVPVVAPVVPPSDDTDSSIVLSPTGAWPNPPAPYSPQGPSATILTSVINLSKRPRYWNSRAAMMESFMPVELVQYAPGVLTNQPDPADNQILNPENYKDQLYDEGEELVEAPPPISAIMSIDTDAEQQFMWTDWVASLDYTQDIIELVISSITQIVLGGGTVVLAINALGMNKILVQPGGTATPNVKAGGTNEMQNQVEGSSVPNIDAKGDVINSQNK